MTFYDTLLITLLTTTFVYGLWNLYTILKLDGESSQITGDVLPTSNYVYSMLNTATRMGVIHWMLNVVENNNSISLDSNEKLALFAGLIIVFAIILSTLLEALIRTLILLIRANKGDDSDDE